MVDSRPPPPESTAPTGWLARLRRVVVGAPRDLRDTQLGHRLGACRR